MTDGFGRPTLPAADSRQAEGHGFQDGDAEPFVGVRHAEEMTLAEGRYQFVFLKRAEKGHRVDQTQLLDELPGPHSMGRVEVQASHDREAPNVPLNPCQGLE